MQVNQLVLLVHSYARRLAKQRLNVKHRIKSNQWRNDTWTSYFCTVWFETNHKHSHKMSQCRKWHWNTPTNETQRNSKSAIQCITFSNSLLSAFSLANIRSTSLNTEVKVTFLVLQVKSLKSQIRWITDRKVHLAHRAQVSDEKRATTMLILIWIMSKILHEDITNIVNSTISTH